MKTTEEVRYLGWKEPFATLMLPPFYKIETRTWDTKYRGLVLITASKNPYSNNKVYKIAGAQQFRRIAIARNSNPPEYYGYAIAVGRLIDSRPMTIEDEDKCFVEYQEGLFCHVYEDVRPIVPFEMKGAQGWRKLDQNTIDKIEFTQTV